MALQLLPIPYGMQWQDWADTVIWLNPSLRTQLPQDADWREWAIRLLQFENRAPRPDLFGKWEDWAAELKRVYGA